MLFILVLHLQHHRYDGLTNKTWTEYSYTDVFTVLKSLNPSKAAGHDNIQPTMIKDGAWRSLQYHYVIQQTLAYSHRYFQHPRSQQKFVRYLNLMIDLSWTTIGLSLYFQCFLKYQKNLSITRLPGRKQSSLSVSIWVSPWQIDAACRHLSYGPNQRKY